VTAIPAVSDASALIALAQIDQLELLRGLFGRIVVPPAVVTETAPSVRLPEWIETRNLGQPRSAQVLRASLGAGECEAISLVLEMEAPWLILDDHPARRLAEGLGLSVIGTLGVLLGAKRHGRVTSVRPLIDALAEPGSGWRPTCTNLCYGMLERGVSRLDREFSGAGL
jgi:predicted nucleic acid-binding protein